MNSKSQLFSKYLVDTETSNLFSDEVLINKILRFETVLARQQATLDIIPKIAGETIGSLLPGIKVNPVELAEGTLQHGIPVIPLLQIVKSQLAPEIAKYIHFGATSQDAMDTALVLIIKESVTALKLKLESLTANLKALSEKYGETPCMGRTRGQLALPTTFGNKINAWLNPLQRQEQKLKNVTTEVLKVQLGGAVGDLSAYGNKGTDLLKAMAAALELTAASSWHNQRDSFSELTHWMAMTSGILGKMGFDILVMAQSEIGELVENGESAGKSSSMPHKNNPILSEALVALARLNSGLQATQLNSLVHANERDATAWILEWDCIPQIIINTATGLNHALTISEKIQVNTDRMKINVDQFKKSS